MAQQPIDTSQLNVGTNAGQLVELTGSPAGLPAVGGSDLTSLGPTITDHTAAGTMYYYNGGTGSPGEGAQTPFSFLILIGSGIWRSIGPSVSPLGSPAPYFLTWDAMNDIPVGAKAIIMTSTYSLFANGSGTTSIEGYIRPGNTNWTVRAPGARYLFHQFEGDGIGTPGGSTSELVIPLDPDDLSFDVESFGTNLHASSQWIFTYRGFVL